MATTTKKGDYLTREDHEGAGTTAVEKIVKELCQQLWKSLTDEEWKKFEEQKTD
jgi:hypothetical protein